MIKLKYTLKNKRGFEIPFSILFAIIAGAIILFLAIYAASRLVGTSTILVQSEAAKDVSNMLNPITNGITSAFATKIDLRKETRIYLSCQESSSKSTFFGREIIAFSEKSGFFGGWPAPGLNISRYNKYVFADDMEQGKTIYLFSKPFYAGFRVDDLIFMNMHKFCFVAAPDEIQNEIIDLGIKNINLSSQITLCDKNSIKVCFGFSQSECNSSVIGDCDDISSCENQYETGYVEKEGQKLIYFKSLIYAAIFSSPENYKCNIARLGKKIYELGGIYKDKAGIVQLKNCDSNLGVYLDNIISLSQNLTTNKLNSLYGFVKQMDEENCKANCKLYSPEGCY